ncbi:hypothetical protein AMATHDRAFT_67686 [Amanita thiersii Skay4041]|uniref:Mitochondrial import inner membrane translocase subunit TIM50 n=1 Tax=Amanita thiersii Skay4041 TaxID=703135 RepID=A0A2A9NDU9_9AGAR|nr:hypothetical protein AMATHDRAFT_67686 [Amanita thiersii Skay4041]
MFSVLTRPIQRRTVLYTARCMSQHVPRPPPPPPLPSSSKQPAEPTPEQSAQVPPETTEKVDTSSLPNLDFLPAEVKEEPKRTGAKSAKDSLTTGERQRRHMLRVSLGMLLLGLGINAVYMGREWDAEELESRRMRLQEAPATRWGRTKKRFSDLFNFFSEPVWSELLPPPLPPPHGKPYTLVVSLDDLLVTSTWDRQHGWRTAKRPGVDYFLAYVSQFYEVVVFTTQNSYTAMPVLDKLDRYNFFISHRLFREHTRTVNGSPVKDLDYLNRDLSKVVCLDTDPEHYAIHPGNAIVIPKWKGDPKDKGLIAMIPFLESIAIYKPSDVRPILDVYHDKDIPTEYAKKEAEAKARHIEEWKKKNKGVSSSGVARLFGLQSSSTSPMGGPPPTYLEQKRREAQLQYMEEQKYLESHKDELEQFMKQQEEALASQVPNSLWDAIDQLKGRKEQQPDAAADTTTVPISSPPSAEPAQSQPQQSSKA